MRNSDAKAPKHHLCQKCNDINQHAFDTYIHHFFPKIYLIPPSGHWEKWQNWLNASNINILMWLDLCVTKEILNSDKNAYSKGCLTKFNIIGIEMLIVILMKQKLAYTDSKAVNTPPRIYCIWWLCTCGYGEMRILSNAF